ncbi:zinc-binding protein [Vibrio metoecus]|uniref:Zinc-binding protein n=1 Tax=Vibrio metoecus TaxID=1481663 RepID=A0ABR4RX53_VIBMT|nr:zinc-binding protein [Vibrio metoecus]
MHYPTFLALMVGATLSGNALADHQHRQHEAHVHGQVELNIAQDGHDVLIEVTAPGADVVGFEHAPQDDAQKQALEKALETLHHPEKLFVLSSKAQCETRDVLIKHNLGSEEHEDHHSHQEGEAHDHDTAHAHSEHDHDANDHQGHDHEADEHDDEHQHGTFTVQYQFHCEAIDELKQVDTQWFQHFPSTEKIQVNVLTEKQQSALQLNAKQTRISL